MPMDAWRCADGYHVALDLPGVDPGSTELTVERNSLTVQATRKAVFGGDDQVLTAERPQGSLTRHLILGDGVDAENVRASYSNGVLNLTIQLNRPLSRDGSRSDTTTTSKAAAGTRPR